jgi:Alpha/beta hydrolase family
MTFKALLATKEGEKISTNLVELEEEDLMPGDVTIAVDYSTVNYKYGVALTGRAPIFRTFPMIPGIDLSGTIEASSHPGIEVGDQVVANGWGLSQTHHGGYAQMARLSGEWFVKIPVPLSTWMPWPSERQAPPQCCRYWLSNTAASLLVAATIGRVSGPVILVGHSHGGTVITGAGEDDRVAGLVYICALAPDADESSQTQQSIFPKTDVFSHIEVLEGRIWLRRDGTKYILRRSLRSGPEAGLGDCRASRSRTSSAPRPEAPHGRPSRVGTS